MKLKTLAAACLTMSSLMGHAESSVNQMTVAGDTFGTKTIFYEKAGNYAVVEGDIILVDLSQKSAVMIPKIGGTRWPHGIIPFEMDEELPLNNKLAVLQAIMHWQEHTSIAFVELTSKNREQYLDHIRFIPAEGTICSSHVGMKGGEQVINLAPRCNTGNTVHEIGHALGLWHEQSRADRNNYIFIDWGNIDEKKKYNFNQHIIDGKDFGEYDYGSIMHYGAYAFSKNGKQTIFPYQADANIGQREKLSDKDIAAINAMYPEV